MISLGITILTHRYNNEYSAFIRSTDYGGGYAYIYGKNICYNTRNGKYVFLVRNSDDKLYLMGWGDDFHYGWKSSNVIQPKSNISAYWVNEEAYITQPYTIRHIYHFVESLNFLWLKLQYINEFPVVSNISFELLCSIIGEVLDRIYLYILRPVSKNK